MANVRLLRQYLQDLAKQHTQYEQDYDTYVGDVDRYNKQVTDGSAILKMGGERRMKTGGHWSAQGVYRRGEGDGVVQGGGDSPFPNHWREDGPREEAVPVRDLFAMAPKILNSDTAKTLDGQTLAEYWEKNPDLKYGDRVASPYMGAQITERRTHYGDRDPPKAAAPKPVDYYYIGGGKFANYLATPGAPDAPSMRNNLSQGDIRMLNNPTQTEAEATVAAAKGYGVNPELAAQTSSSSSLASLESLRSAPGGDTGMGVLARVLRNKL